MNPKRVLSMFMIIMLIFGIQSFAEEETPAPTTVITSETTVEPTTEVSVEPTIETTVELSPEPTAEQVQTVAPDSSADMTEEPTPEPTIEPSAEATDNPTPEPESIVTWEAPEVLEFTVEGELLRNDAGAAFELFSATVAEGQPQPQVGIESRWFIEYTGGEDCIYAECAVYRPGYEDDEYILHELFVLDEKAEFAWSPEQEGKYILRIALKDESGNKLVWAGGEFTVVPEHIEISLPETKLDIEVGMTLPSGAEVKPDGKKLVYAVDDPLIASVDEAGNVTGIAVGSTLLTVKVADEDEYVSTMEITVVPATVKSITLPYSAITIGQKETVRLSPAAEPSFAETSFSYVSSNKKYVTVSADGVITGVRKGSAYVTITADNGVSTRLKVTVRYAPRYVKLTLGRSVVGVGETAAYTVKYNSDAGGSYTVTTSDETIARVEEGKKIVALAPGVVTVTVRSYNGKSASAKLTVKPAPSEINITGEPLRVMGVKQTAVLKYKLSEGSVSTVNFSSSDPDIVSTTAAGTLTARAEGTAVITATTHNGLTHSVAVNVLPAPSSVKVAATKVILAVGEKYQLAPVPYPEGTACSFTYSSSSKSRAVVNASGLVTAKKTGTVYITIKAHNGKYVKVKFTVKSAPRKVSLSLPRYTVGVGEELKYTVKYNSGAAGAYTVASSDETVARIAENGAIIAEAPGTAVITVRSFNGKQASVTLTVKPAPAEVSFTTDPFVIGVKDVRTLKYALTEGSAARVWFESYDPTIARVDSVSGKLTAVAPGIVTIGVKTHNGCEDTLEVTVVPAPSSVYVPSAKLTLGLGDKYQLTPAAKPDGTAATFKYSSSSSRVKVDSTGMLTAKKTGSAYITVKAHNGKYVKVKVTVVKAPSKVTATVRRNLLGVGESTVAGYTLPKYTAATCSYWCEENGVLTVDASGNISAVAPGTCKVYVKTHNGKTDDVTVTVLDAPEYLIPGCDTLDAGVGAKVPFSAALPQNTAGEFHYESLDPAIVTIDPATGVVTGVSEGTAIVRAVAYNGAYGECSVNVLPAPTAISSETTSLKLLAGDTATIDYAISPENAFDQVTYSTSNSKVARVENGVVRAVGAGSAVVTISTYNGHSVKCTVTVPKSPSAIVLSRSIANISTGEQLQLSYTITKDTETRVMFSSSNPSVVEVDELTGLVTGVAPGTAIVTVRTLNGKKDVCMVNVDVDAEADATVSGDFEITFMNIGRNDGILIYCGGEYAFIDSGVRGNGLTAVKYMRSVGVDSLKYYIGTHAHRDHVGGAPAILAAFDTEIVIVPHKKVATKIVDFASTTAEKTAAKNANYQIITRGNVFYLGGAKFECLGPVSIKNVSTGNTEENANSLVLKVTYGSNTFLLTGDATGEEVKAIEKANPGCLCADVLKNPHHNGRLDYIVNICKPSITVFSTDSGNLPTKSYLSYITGLGSEVYITSGNRDGHVTMISDGTTISVHTQY